MEIKEFIKERKKLTGTQQAAFNYLKSERIDVNSYEKNDDYGSAIFEKEEVIREATVKEIQAYYFLKMNKQIKKDKGYRGCKDCIFDEYADCNQIESSFDCPCFVYRKIMKDKIMVISNG